MAMHLHTVHQPGASMESHIYNASKLGMKYIRFTDHDCHTGPKEFPAHSFDFTKGTLKYSDAPEQECGWDIINDPEISFDDKGLNIVSSSDTEKIVGIIFDSTDRRHNASMIADVTLEVGISCELTGNARVIIDIQMSQRPPEHEYAHLRYVLGEAKQCGQHMAEIQLEKREDNMYTLHPTADLQREDTAKFVGGLDNAFSTISVLLETNSGTAKCRLFHYKMHQKHGFDEVITRQRVIADEVGRKYGIKPFVTTEISGAGQHKNCFSTKVPVIDYSAWNYDITQMEAIGHVRKHGGIFAYNHPFEKYKRKDLTDADKEKIFQKELLRFISSKVYGATMMEVMFYKGRGGFSFAQHMKLWDMLSMAGVFITGYGDSDSHHGYSGWFEGQNAASWIAADETIPFPVPEDVFIESMKAGRIYAGDPVALKDPISFTCGNAQMGAVIPVSDRDHDSRKMKFTAVNPDENWSIRIMIDGELYHEQKIGKHSGEFTYEFEVKPEMPVSIARAELYNAEERVIMTTNPIYLVRTAEFAGEIPTERLYKE